MEYQLQTWAMGHQSGVELSPDEYTGIVAALSRIYLATDIEEKLDLLLENYFEYERDVLELALRSNLFRGMDYSRAMGETQLVNRRTMNLLAAARLYIDQLKHVVSQYFATDPDRKTEVYELFSAEYDRHLEYRTAEALRNHAQHRSLPLYALKWSQRWEEHNTPQQRLRFAVVPIISVQQLADEGGFKQAVLAELKAADNDALPLTPILRRYVESLTSVHEAVRSLLSAQAESDHQVLLQAFERARQELPGLTGLAVTKGEPEEKVAERHHLSMDAWERRESLMRKNTVFPNLSRRYVSGEHCGDLA